MSRRLFAVLGVVVVVGLSGCRSLAPPNWFRAGPAEYQQMQAQQFDPYPETDAGPTIVGGRPMEYDRSPPEVLRVQPQRDYLRSGWLPWNWRRR